MCRLVEYDLCLDSGAWVYVIGDALITFLRIAAVVNLIFGLIALFSGPGELPPGVEIDGATMATKYIGALLFLSASAALFYAAAKRSRDAKKE